MAGPMEGCETMTRIYMRAGMSPLAPMPIGDAVAGDRFGSNTGNLVYQYSVFRTVMQPDTEFDARDFIEVCAEPGGVERINETCDMAILTLANAFRVKYPLKQLADMVRRLKIPCVVVGCGVQAESLDEIRGGLPFDDDVRAFVDAVLDKSASLGLRGEFTAEYLTRLGYVPEKHFTVIGCPSFFMHGPDMPEPKMPAIDASTRFSMNTRPTQRPEMHALLADVQRRYPNYHLVLQRVKELRMLAFGIPHRVKGADRDTTGYYPFDQRHRDVRSGRVLGFTEARSWFEYFNDIDYSFGSRIHGNIAAVVSGVPAFVFTPDTRTEELCRFGNIPFMPLRDLKGGEDIRGILEKQDFRAVCRGHKERFQHYVDFLNRNGVKHIYAGGVSPERVPFDEAMAKLPAGGVVKYGCLSGGEVLRRRLAFAGELLKKKLK